MLIIAVTGCSPQQRPPQQRESQHVPAKQRRMARQYFRANNAAAREGSRAQQEFFQRTQHPDFTDRRCDLDGMTVSIDPVLSTLRRDREFTVAGTRPRGAAWVVAVEVTVRRDRAIVGEQIGSQHLFFLRGHVYGFAPCPS